jgi:hypothetical protein
VAYANSFDGFDVIYGLGSGKYGKRVFGTDAINWQCDDQITTFLSALPHMSIVNPRVIKLLGKTVTGKGPWSIESLLVADAILRAYGHPASAWDVYLVGVQVAGDHERIEAMRRQIMDDQSGPVESHFEMMSDAWVAYLAIQKTPGTSVEPDALLVEILAPFDVCDPGGVLASHPLSVVPRIPHGTAHFPIDLADMKLV